MILEDDHMLPYTQPAPYRSQWGEDRWLLANGILPTLGVFVDVGAGDGARGSNTLLLEQRGWHGLCVDADPRNRDPLSKRRRCVVETCAVSSRSGSQTFGMHCTKSSWSGLIRSGPEYEQITVRTECLEELLQRNSINEIDLLSIDVEGTELDVWNSFDMKIHTPKVVIIEYDDEHPDRHTQHIMSTLGCHYRLLHRTPANLILSFDDGR